MSPRKLRPPRSSRRTHIRNRHAAPPADPTQPVDPARITPPCFAEWSALETELAAIGPHRIALALRVARAAATGGVGVSPEEEQQLAAWMAGIVDLAVARGGRHAAAAIVFLCLLSLVLHPDQGAALALDEPDAHLHPSALRRLLALAHESHPRRCLIIVTHSNALLDELRDPVASIRVVEATPQGARIRRLDAESLKAWRTEYTLSELRQTGLLDPSNTSYGNDE